MKERVAKLVTFGRGGDCVYYGRYWRSMGYGSPERPHAADTDIPDGVVAIDQRAAIETRDDAYDWAFQGPMVDVDLPEGQVDPCEPSGIMIDAMKSDSGNQFGQLLKLHEMNNTQPGPLDHVSIKQYVDGWRLVGARIGFYKNGKIIWEDQEGQL